MTKTVLIVDDEPDLVTTLEYNLQQDGYETRTALDGKTALECAHQKPYPDLIVLDVMLPDISGTEVCRQIRSDEEIGHIPVMMLTAKGDEIDRVVGFELGADDYMNKPFSTRELLLRIRAILRRAGAVPLEKEEDSFVFGCLKLDKAAHRMWVEEEEVQVTALEFRLVETFLVRKGRVQTRDTLLLDVWGYDAAVTTRTVDTHIKRLRQKLGAAGKYIETIRGVGYRFTSVPS
jgi:two-component system phosphate regulon response regulator PhoB